MSWCGVDGFSLAARWTACAGYLLQLRKACHAVWHPDVGWSSHGIPARLLLPRFRHFTTDDVTTTASSGTARLSVCRLAIATLGRSGGPHIEKRSAHILPGRCWLSGKHAPRRCVRCGQACARPHSVVSRHSMQPPAALIGSVHAVPGSKCERRIRQAVAADVVCVCAGASGW